MLGRKVYVMVAKEVLIKSVVHAIPTYIMEVFKLPKQLCEELTQLIRFFWWGKKGGDRGKCTGLLGKNF
jgi:hypothetical protein